MSINLENKDYPAPNVYFPPKDKMESECVCVSVRKVNFLTKRLLLNNLCLKSLLVISAGFSTLSCPYMHSLSARWMLMQVLHWAVRALSPAGYQIAARLQCKVLTDGCSLSHSLSLFFCWRKQKGCFKGHCQSTFKLSLIIILPAHLSFLYHKLVFPPSSSPSSSIQLLLSDLKVSHALMWFLYSSFLCCLWMTCCFLLCGWALGAFLRHVVHVILRLQV